jgi:predicted metal-dependent hydrolase
MLRQLLKSRAAPEDETIHLDGFEAAIRFSARRKTLTIKVAAGKVLVQAPAFATRREIEGFIRHKSHWIREKVAQQAAQLQARQRCWRSGEYLPLLGADLCLRIEPAARNQISLEGNILLVRTQGRSTAEAMERGVQAQVQRWYKHYAATDFAERLAHWQKITGITASGHCVKTYKARWGSCNHRAELSFNWKLIMAPPAVIDYVVVHELCHIVHFNHSPTYWRLVERHQPDYRVHKQWLRDNGLRLEL